MKPTHLLIPLALSCLAASGVAQTSLGVGDFEWSLVLENPDDLGVATVDPLAGTIYVHPSSSGCFCEREVRFEAVAPYDGVVTVGATTIAHDSLAPDRARYYVGENLGNITQSTGEFLVTFEVFGGVTFGLGSWGDDCCGSMEVTFHDFSFVATSATPALEGALDVRREFVAPMDETFGHLDVVGDLDGDGVDDLAFNGGSPSFPLPAKLVTLSGADLSPLWTVERPWNWTSVTNALTGPGDVDLDGVPDVGASVQGGLRVYSGVDGTEISSYVHPGNPAFIPGEAAGAGDIDLDGLPDVWMTFSGRVMLISGTGVLLHDVSFPAGSTPSSSGSELAHLPDVNGDGYDDVVAGAASSSTVTPRVIVISGRSGAILHDFTGDVGSSLGYSVADAGDVDGDGVHDVLAGAPSSLGGDGEARLWSGATGAELADFVGAPRAGLGTSVSGAGDVDGDGFADVLLGGRSLEDLTHQPDGRVELRSGADGSLLHFFTRSAEDDFGLSVVGGFDADLDGLPEIAVSAQRAGAGGEIQLFGDLDLPYGVARLEASGTLLPGSAYDLQLSGGPPFASTYLVIGLSQLDAPFKGGTLVPAPDVVIGGLPLDAQGALVLAGTWPAGVPSGTRLVFQTWIPDVHGPLGFGASNGVLFIAP